MDQVRVGKFIASLRNELHYTQSQLGEKLGISDKSVSKWERGIQMPDLSNLAMLSKIFNITIDEILSAKRIDKNKVEDKNNALLNVIRFYNNRLKKRMFFSIICVCFIFIFVIIGLFFSQNYNKNKVYSIHSKDNDFTFKGYLIYNQTQNILFISEANIQSKLYGTELDPVVTDVKVDLMYENNILVDKDINIKKKLSLSEVINNFSLILDDHKSYDNSLINYKTDLSKLKLKITYYDLKHKENKIDIPLQFEETFSNNKFIY